jgi:hypothetical protein
LMSCSTILYNKYLYSGTFMYPITLTAIHMAFASAVTGLLRLTGVRLRPPARMRPFGGSRLTRVLPASARPPPF